LKRLHLVHFGTVSVLFSMMLIVAYLHLAGFFDWVTEESCRPWLESVPQFSKPPPEANPLKPA
jgi:hypothetical protein